jgi:hypothetical protein
MGVSSMSGKHSLKFKLRQAMMYNHTLFISYGKQEYKVHAEDSPDSTKGLLVSFNELTVEKTVLNKITTAFQVWAEEQKINFTII